MQSGEHFTAVVLAVHSSTCTIRRQSVYDTADITHLLHGLRVVSPRCLTRDNDAFNSMCTCDTDILVHLLLVRVFPKRSQKASVNQNWVFALRGGRR